MDIFFDHLSKDSDAYATFATTEMPVHKERLWAMLNAAVSGLSDVTALKPTLRALGARHVDYGVTPSMFAAVGNSLIHTLSVGLGDKFTESVKADWVAIYGVIQEQMLLGFNNPNNAIWVPDKNLAYDLKPSVAIVPQCEGSATPMLPSDFSERPDASPDATTTLAGTTLPMCDSTNN